MLFGDGRGNIIRAPKAASAAIFHVQCKGAIGEKLSPTVAGSWASVTVCSPRRSSAGDLHRLIGAKAYGAIYHGIGGIIIEKHQRHCHRSCLHWPRRFMVEAPKAVLSSGKNPACGIIICAKSGQAGGAVNAISQSLDGCSRINSDGDGSIGPG